MEQKARRGRLMGLVLSLLVARGMDDLLAMQQPEPDVLGWRDTRWGMTEDQVLNALGSDAQRKQDIVVLGPDPVNGRYRCTLEVPRLQVEEFTFKVDLCFTESKLSLVRLMADKPATSVHFKRLEEMLTEKYGPATLRTDEPDRHPVPGFKNEKHDRTWRFKSTTISLEENDMGSYGHFVSVTYAPPSADATKL